MISSYKLASFLPLGTIRLSAPLRKFVAGLRGAVSLDSPREANLAERGLVRTCSLDQPRMAVVDIFPGGGDAGIAPLFSVYGNHRGTVNRRGDREKRSVP